MVRRVALLLFGARIISLVAAQDYPTKCYVLNGEAKSDAGFRCDNSTTGHSACCGIGAVCYSNGVCAQDNNGIQDYLRVGCTDETWEDPACLTQCESFANSSTAGIRFCNGAITNTNQYCCDDGSAGIGSFKCCRTPTSIFRINPIPTVVAQIPLIWSSTRSTTTTSTSSTSTSTSSSSSTTATSLSPTSGAPVSAPTSTSTDGAESKNKENGTNSAAIGVGVGVPVVVIAVGLIGFFFWRRSKKSRAQHAVELQGNRLPLGGPAPYRDMRDGMQGPLMEAEGSLPGVADGQKGYFGGRNYSAAPQELDSPPRVHELSAR
ncbi:hypothetical protein B0O99DRAFT_689903 [Bisporella sp. PMI_857]|nr:hypothetical protein B0O99DRAFT_689903 [Bisporella sp. PMI_857]